MRGIFLRQLLDVAVEDDNSSTYNYLRCNPLLSIRLDQILHYMDRKGKWKTYCTFQDAGLSKAQSVLMSRHLCHEVQACADFTREEIFYREYIHTLSNGMDKLTHYSFLFLMKFSKNGFFFCVNRRYLGPCHQKYVLASPFLQNLCWLEVL
jgi:hypothetical protein